LQFVLEVLKLVAKACLINGFCNKAENCRVRSFSPRRFRILRILIFYISFSAGSVKSKDKRVSPAKKRIGRFCKAKFTSQRRRFYLTGKFCLFACLILPKFGGKGNRKRPGMNVKNFCGQFSGFNLLVAFL